MIVPDSDFAQQPKNLIFEARRLQPAPWHDSMIFHVWWLFLRIILTILLHVPDKFAPLALHQVDIDLYLPTSADAEACLLLLPCDSFQRGCRPSRLFDCLEGGSTWRHKLGARLFGSFKPTLSTTFPG